MTGLAVNGVVTNNETGSIYSGGDGVYTLIGGDGTVTNSGEITSTGAIAVNLNTGGTATVTNNEDAEITGFNGGISAVSLLEDVNITSAGSIDTTNGTGVLGVALVGNVDIDTTGENSHVTSTNGSGIVGAALTDGDVTIDSGVVNAGFGRRCASPAA